jgi:hypothetical protein
MEAGHGIGTIIIASGDIFRSHFKIVNSGEPEKLPKVRHDGFAASGALGEIRPGGYVVCNKNYFGICPLRGPPTGGQNS